VATTTPPTFPTFATIANEDGTYTLVPNHRVYGWTPVDPKGTEADRSGEGDEAQAGVTAAKRGKSTRGAKATKATPEPEVDEPEDDDVEEETADTLRAKYSAMKIVALRKVAVAAGFDADQVAEATKSDLIDTLVEDALGNDDEDEDGDEDNEDGEDETPSADELKAMPIAALRRYAASQAEDASELKGLSKAELIEWLTSDDEEEGDEDEDDSDDADDDHWPHTAAELDDDTETFDRDDLEQRSIKELKDQCRELGVRLKAGLSKSQIIDLLMEQAGEDVDDE
jgi:hypothetical protein